MTQAAQNLPPFYSCTLDTRFLELPSGVITLTRIQNVPMRPTASIELAYDPELDLVVCSVKENSDRKPTSSPVVRYNGQGFEFELGGYDAATQKHAESWKPWTGVRGVSGDIEATCYLTLAHSDVFCPRQARVDFPSAINSDFWNQLMGEMQRLHPVASVMLQ